MIARIILPLILLILLPDIYLYIKFIHKKKKLALNYLINIYGGYHHYFL